MRESDCCTRTRLWLFLILLLPLHSAAQEVDTCQYDTLLIEGYTHVLSADSETGLAGKFDNSYQSSPVAASVGQYSRTPVNMHTGTALLSIPLYTIENGDYSLPISLFYTASGIKVAQEASRIGLGWQLQAGGTITRTVLEEDDLMSPLAYSYLTDQHGSGLRTLYADYEPDIFSYNFGEHHGKFLYVKGYEEIRGHPNLGHGDTLRITRHFMPLQPEGHISISYDSITSVFCITTSELIRYYFREKEIVQKRKVIGNPHGFISYIDSMSVESDSILMSSQMPFDYVPDFAANTTVTTAWYLSEIRLPNNEAIIFHYETLEDAYLSPMRRERIHFRNNSSNPNFSLADIDVLTWERTNEQPVLQEIFWKNGRIVFTPANTPRTDIRAVTSFSSDFPLEYVRVYNSIGEQVKALQLHHSYFTGKDTLQSIPASHVPYLCDRLRLDSISILGSEGGRMSHAFTYDTSDSLPAKNASYLDRWGYYTGKDLNTFSYDVVGSKRLYSTERRYKDALESMESVPLPTDKAAVWSLTSHRSPFGAVTEYDYECHQVRTPNRVMALDTTVVEFIKPYSVTQLDTMFTLVGVGALGVEFEYLSTPIPLVTNPPYDQLIEQGFSSIEDTEAHTLLLGINHTWTDRHTGFDNHTERDTIDGRIRLRFYRQRYFNSRGDVHVSMSSFLNAQTKVRLTFIRTTPVIPAGGIRLREMRTPEGTFRYRYAPGSMERDPVSAVHTRMGYRSFIEYHSRPMQFCTNPYSGITVGYDTVCVETVSDGIISRIDSVFYHNETEGMVDIYDFGRPQPTNGLTRKTVSVSDGCVRKEADFFYDSMTTDSMTIARGRDNRREKYTLSDYFTPLKQHQEKVFGQASDSIPARTTLTKVTYNHFLLMPKTTKVIRDSVETSEVRLVYSKDTDPFPLWREHGRLLLPVEENVLRNGMTCRRTVRTYTPDSLAYPAEEYTFYNIPGADWPQTMEFHYPPGAQEPWHYTPDVRYTSYDSAGRCTSYQTRMGQSTVQLWGYSHQYLIAEIRNAILEDVTSCGIDVEALADKAVPSAADWTLLKSLRTQLPQSAVTLYQYRPLVGVTSIFNPAGMETRYAYDEFNRLIRECIVEGGTEHVIKEYEYKYATEQ